MFKLLQTSFSRKRERFQSFWTPLGPKGLHNTYPTNLPVERVQTAANVVFTQTRAFPVILDSIGLNRTSQHISDKLTGRTCSNLCNRRYNANERFPVILDSIGPNRTSQHISDKLTGITCSNCRKRRYNANESVSSHFGLHWAQ